MKSIFLLSILAAIILNADSLNSPLKNPSVSVSGIQRPATNITVDIIPTASLGTACNSSTDTIAVAPDRSMTLICYSNTWVQAAVANSAAN